MSGVLGLDMSYTRSGLVWIESVPGEPYLVQSKTITIRPGPRRLYRACRLIMDAIALFEKPKLAVLEDGFFAGSQKVTRMLRELNAITKLVLESANIEWVEISSTKCKKWMADRGDAEKYQVAEALKRKFGIEFPDDPGFDLSDAASLACYGLANGGKQ